MSFLLGAQRIDFLVYCMLLTGALLVIVPGPAPGQEQLGDLYNAAKQAEAKGEYAAATRNYEQIVRLRPDLAEAWANLGNLFYVQRKYEQAGAAFRTAIKLKPQLAAPHFFLGVIAFRARDLDTARQQLGRAAELDAGNPLVQLHLGYVYYAALDYEKAIPPLEACVRADETNVDAWYHLSKLYSQLSRRYFDRLQSGYSASAYTHLARAHFFEGQGNWNEAAQEYEKVRVLRPSDALKRRIDFVRRKSEGKDAEWEPAGGEADGSTTLLHRPPPISGVVQQYWTTKQALSPASSAESPERLYNLAEHTQLLSYLSALWVYGGSPDSYRAHQLKGQSLEAADRNDEAVAEYRKALEKNPELQTVHFAIGSIYWRAAEFDAALPELKAELEVNPNDPQAHYEIADILLSQQKSDEAAVHYRKCLQFAPDTVEAHLALDRIYTSQDQLDKALVHLRKAAAIAPKDPTPQYRLWLLYRKTGKTTLAEQARRAFEELKRSGGERSNAP